MRGIKMSISKKYEFHFDIWGLIVFLTIMAPNILWFALPAPNDVLRTESITPNIDMVSTICQILMAILLCCTIQRIGESKKRMVKTMFFMLVFFFCALYYSLWIVYYSGNATFLIILSLTISPCLTFLFFEMGKKNWLALIPTVLFTGCHTYYAIMNFH